MENAQTQEAFEHGQFERLPKWARQYIERLQRELKDSKRAIENLQADIPTSTHWTVGIRGEKKYIPDSARIIIERPDSRHTLSLKWDNQRQMLNVAAEFSRLIVHPYSSNWIYVVADGR